MHQTAVILSRNLFLLLKKNTLKRVDQPFALTTDSIIVNQALIMERFTILLVYKAIQSIIILLPTSMKLAAIYNVHCAANFIYCIKLITTSFIL